jgi:hypothetical protein
VTDEERVAEELRKEQIDVDHYDKRRAARASPTSGRRSLQQPGQSSTVPRSIAMTAVWSAALK